MTIMLNLLRDFSNLLLYKQQNQYHCCQAHESNCAVYRGYFIEIFINNDQSSGEDNLGYEAAFDSLNGAVIFTTQMPSKHEAIIEAQKLIDMELDNSQ